MRLFDAHNHLQDARFGDQQDELIADWPPLARHVEEIFVRLFGG